MTKQQETYWVIEEAYSESDWIMGNVFDMKDVADPLHTFAEKQIQYNQNEYMTNTCTIYQAIWAYSDLRGIKIPLKTRKLLCDMAEEAWLDPSIGWYVHKAVDLVAKYFGDVSYWRVRLWSTEYYELLAKWFSMMWGYGWNAVYNKDRDDNRSVDKNNRWKATYYHAVRGTMVKEDNKVVHIADNYDYRHSNVYWLPNIGDKQALSWNMFNWAYFYFDKIDIEMQDLPRHILRTQAKTVRQREIIIAWENEVSAWLKRWGEKNKLFVEYTADLNSEYDINAVITRMLLDLKFIRAWLV